ncbi:hypothetical protein GGX14DRAFT_358394 [Mycena pura]|uniref:BTB domain-containing protein n=1 Tax=Mycena pura TaxID=153505 RepID=A0AAD6VLY7_9AGAR|nr:hypothetical protein GGX14DRAFT_358394 [Mycena pura]
MPRCRSGASGSPISTASLFTARAFPPPSLAAVPIEYIIDQLHNFAPLYWDKPDTADCTLVIPVPHGRAGATVPAFSMSSDPGISRRVTEPALNSVPKISLKLHVDYLSAHSTFLRGLFSGASSLDLISAAALTQAPSPSVPSANGQFTVPPNRLPRLMPCSPDHPILFLPIPDPTSIHLLVHWMYFGSTAHIADALNSGAIEWEGIARNVEYLGLPASIKVFLGQWYAHWLHQRADSGASESDEDSDLDVDSDSDSDADTVYYSDEERKDAPDASRTVDLRAAMAAAADDSASDDVPKRGRARARPVSVSSAHSI